jgi:coproporphyrinogen III oxidase
MVKLNLKKIYGTPRRRRRTHTRNRERKSFEKGGVNISAVHGNYQKPCKKMFGVGEADFFACGLSLVLHLRTYGAYSSCQLALF